MIPQNQPKPLCGIKNFIILYWFEPLPINHHSRHMVKRKIKQTLFEILASEDCDIDLLEIVQKVKLNLFSS